MHLTSMIASRTGKTVRPSTPTIPFVPPQLATLVDAAPSGDEWIHEVKFDGFRILCRVQDGEVTLFTRSGQDWTARFAEVAAAVTRLNLRSALIDGEVAVLRADGTTSFQSLQNHLAGGAIGGLTYFAFDLLFLNHEDLRSRPLEARKTALQRIIAGKAGSSAVAEASSRVVRYTDHIIGSGPAFFEKASAAGLEGIVSKLRNDSYHSGRGPSWVKTKSLKRQEFVVGGFTEPEGARSGIGALLVGLFREGKLVYAGKVGTGFSHKVALDLRRRLDRLLTEQSAFTSVIRGAGRQIRWVKPLLVAEVAYAEMTTDGKLRHPSFQGLREDKPAAEVVEEGRGSLADLSKRKSPASRDMAVGRTMDKPAPGTKHVADSAAHKTSGRSGAAPSKPEQVAGVTLSHPERVLEDTTPVTKRDLAHYYEVIAPFMLPHLVGRPLSLVRCPEGTTGKCFFMKHAAFATPQLRRVTIKEKAEKGEYLITDTLAGLIGLVQMSVLEIHTWNSVEETLEQPDRVVFDFDPGPQAQWADVLAGVMLVKGRVEQLGCTTFVKTTGGKGLHVVVPLAPNANWDECKVFSQLVSDSVVAEHPKRFTTAMRKAGREDKILIDYFRNTRGSTSVAAFSTRARPGLPVSMPISWDDLPAFRPDRPFTISSTPPLIRGGYRDPWAQYESSRVDLKRTILKASSKGPRSRRRRK